MDQWLTRASIWLAIAAWAAAILLYKNPRRARAVWAGALVAYLLHIGLAYAVFYEWSHRIAWEQTALDTARVTGWHSGIGLIVNFAFAAALAVDLARQWRGHRASPWIVALVVFMILNGAVVFGEGPVRWYGLSLLCGLACVAAASRRRRKRCDGHLRPETPPR